VISSASWAVTKGFTGGKKDKKNKTRFVRKARRGEQEDKGPVEICYCHTPPRYLYGYETSRNWKKHWYIRLYATIVNHFMRMYDFEQAQKVSFFIANSREVQQRIRKFYRRDSIVINPPVDLPKRTDEQGGQEESGGQGKYFLTGGRLEAAKNFELIILACNQLKVPLKIYGSGSQEKYLRSIAGAMIEFLGRVSEEEKYKLMARAKAFIVMAVDEDFGITPVEAMAAGTPVIAYKGGGYLETVVEGKTGVFVEEATVGSLVGVLREMGVVSKKIKTEDCRKQARKFSKERFKEEIVNFINNSFKRR
jgi:glycosyltransferase involved in cell wall biosynthesis